MKPISACKPSGVVNTAKQIIGCDVQRIRQPLEVIEGRLARTDFKVRHGGCLKAGDPRQLGLVQIS